MNIEALNNTPRLLIEADFAPVQGTRFQPTGFPDLGAAQFQSVEGISMLLVESAQSMANRLEDVCWDHPAGNWQTPLRGLPFIEVVDSDNKSITNSVLEAHRLNSPYITGGKLPDGEIFLDRLKTEFGISKTSGPDLNQIPSICFKYDLNSLLHGVFLEKAAGVIRKPRALTAFIEASEVRVAPSGGVKNDRVSAKGDQEAKRSAAEGFGNVPFHRDEFTGKITAYFNLDLAQIRGYGLPSEATDLLIALSLYKVQRLLDLPFRPRTACDLEATEIRVKRPDGFTLPPLSEIESALPLHPLPNLLKPPYHLNYDRHRIPLPGGPLACNRLGYPRQ